MKLCSLHNIHFVSDEIYGLTIFDTGDPSAVPFTSALSIDTAGLINDDLVHVVYGLSKDFGAPGLHLASLITRNSDLIKSFRAIGLLHAPSGASCAIGCAILDDTTFVDEIIALSRSRLAQNYRMVTTMLDEAGIRYWRGGNTRFFLWLDLSPFLPAADAKSSKKPDEMLSDRLLNGGVYLNPNAEWSEYPGWFRLIYSFDSAKIEAGVRR